MRNELFNTAKEAMTRAYCPYSQFPVGASLVTTSGDVYSGSNVENASFPEGWCAETSALAQMIAATVSPDSRKIVEVAVVAAEKSGVIPCGGCLQRLAEFGDKNTKIHLCNSDGVIRSETLGSLLPKSFSL